MRPFDVFFFKSTVELIPFRIIATLFKRAKECQPSCIIIDDAEHLFARRSDNQSGRESSIRCCLSAAMSRVMEDETIRIMLIATTNLPASFDEAFLRRFPCCVYVRLPDRGTILAIMQQNLAAYDLADDVTNEKLHGLATELATHRTLSGYDLSRALRMELRRLLTQTWNTTKHFREVSTADKNDTIGLTPRDRSLSKTVKRSSSLARQTHRVHSNADAITSTWTKSSA